MWGGWTSIAATAAGAALALGLTACGGSGTSATTASASATSSSPSSSTAVATTTSTTSTATDVGGFRLEINQLVTRITTYCPNPQGNPPTPNVNRPNDPSHCRQAIADLRSGAQRFLAALPSLQATVATRTGLDQGLRTLISRLDAFESIELNGTDADVVHEADSFVNALEEIRNAGR